MGDRRDEDALHEPLLSEDSDVESGAPNGARPSLDAAGRASSGSAAPSRRATGAGSLTPRQASVIHYDDDIAAAGDGEGEPAEAETGEGEAEEEQPLDTFSAQFSTDASVGEGEELEGIDEEDVYEMKELIAERPRDVIQVCTGRQRRRRAATASSATAAPGGCCAAAPPLSAGPGVCESVRLCLLLNPGSSPIPHCLTPCRLPCFSSSRCPLFLLPSPPLFSSSLLLLFLLPSLPPLPPSPPCPPPSPSL